MSSRRGEIAVTAGLALPLLAAMARLWGHLDSSSFAVLAGGGALLCAGLCAALLARASSNGGPRTRARHRFACAVWALLLGVVWAAFFVLDLHRARFALVLALVPAGALLASAIGLKRRRVAGLVLAGAVGVEVVWFAALSLARAHPLPAHALHASALVAAGVAMALLACGRLPRKRAALVGGSVGLCVVWIAMAMRDAGCTGLSDVFDLTLLLTAGFLFLLGPLFIGRVLVPVRRRAVARRASSGSRTPAAA